MVTHAQKVAAVQMIKAIADALKELREVPSGEFYARVMGHLDIHAYNAVFDVLVGAGLIEIKNDVIRWK